MVQLTRLITPPAAEPVTLAEAKSHLRIEHNLDDATVLLLIQAARQYVEKICWRGIVTQTWELVLNGFPRSTEGIVLPKGNLQSITSVKYSDQNGVEQTFDAASYEADIGSVPGLAKLKYNLDWPVLVRDYWNSVVIRYVVGWAVGDVPAPLKQAILLLVSQMYEHRTPEVVGTIISPVRFSFDALLSVYRLRRFS